MCFGRWDNDNYHLTEPDQTRKINFDLVSYFPGADYNNVRLKDFDLARNHDKALIKIGGEPRMPWRDIHVRMEGPIVNDMSRSFMQYWSFMKNDYNTHEQGAVLGVSKMMNQPGNSNNPMKSFHKMRTMKEKLDKPTPKWDNHELSKKKKSFHKKNNTDMKPLLEDEMENEHDTGVLTKVLEFNPISSRRDGQGGTRDNSKILNLKLTREEEVAANVEHATRALNFSPQTPHTATAKSNREKMFRSVQPARNAKMELENLIQIARDTVSEEENGNAEIEMLVKKNPENQEAFDQNSSIVDDQDDVEEERGVIGKPLLPNAVPIIDKPLVINRESIIDQLKAEVKGEDDKDEFRLRLTKVGASKPNFTHNVQLVRSAGLWSLGLQSKRTENSIQMAYLELIGAAKKFIYIENQFFISSTAGEPIKNKIAEALVLRIRRAIEENQNFLVVVVIPLLPGFEGSVEEKKGAVLRLTLGYQQYTISRGETSVMEE